MKAQHARNSAERVKTGPLFAEEEILVLDARGQLTPAQMVEHKLMSMLDSCPVLVSNLQTSLQRRPV